MQIPKVQLSTAATGETEAVGKEVISHLVLWPEHYPIHILQSGLDPVRMSPSLMLFVLILLPSRADFW